MSKRIAVIAAAAIKNRNCTTFSSDEIACTMCLRARDIATQRSQSYRSVDRAGFSLSTYVILLRMEPLVHRGARIDLVGLYKLCLVSIQRNRRKLGSKIIS